MPTPSSPCPKLRSGKCIWAGVFLVVSLLGLSWGEGWAQERRTARFYLDTLGSPYMGGRGYVDEGALRAARFLAGRMKAIGLEPLFSSATENPYFQAFALDVNTFPGVTEVRLDGQRLRSGYDYITDPSSGGADKLALRVVRLDSMLLQNQERLQASLAEVDLDQSAIVVQRRQVPNYRDNPVWDYVLNNRMQAAAIIVLERKLTWGVGRASQSYPQLHILADRFPEDAEQVFIDLEQRLERDYPSQNVAGMLPARRASADSFLLVTAHYDHLGKLGDSAFFPGANDNASGVAMMMDLAAWFQAKRKRALKSYHLVFVAFGGEEAGLVGSRFFTEHPPIPLDRIAMVLNLDLMATGEGGLMVVNGKPQPMRMELLQSLNQKHELLTQVRSRPNAANSDHFFFAQKGVPAFFWYLMGNYPYYHDVHDTPDKPGLAGYPQAFELVRRYLMSFPP